MGKLELFSTAGGKVKWSSHFQNNLAVSQKVKQSYHITQQFYS